LKKCAKKRKIEHFFEVKNAVFSRKIVSFLRKNQKNNLSKIYMENGLVEITTEKYSITSR
jgi:hypothetical protein